MALPHPFGHVTAAGHVRELGNVDAALVCVPAGEVQGIGCELLQQRLPIVECARLEGGALKAHYQGLGDAARNHRVAAIVGAGWDPGVLPLTRRLFEVLIPRGHTQAGAHPGMSLHHSAVVERMPGVRAALVCERRSAGDRRQRYVYVQPEQSASIGEVERAIAGDPLYAGEETLVFPVADLAALEAAGSGVVLERRGSGEAGVHQSLLLEARFDVVSFAAQVMLDAARKLPQLAPGAHPYWLGS